MAPAASVRVLAWVLVVAAVVAVGSAQTPSPSASSSASPSGSQSPSPTLDPNPPPYVYRNTTFLEQYATVLVGRQVVPPLLTVPQSVGLVYFTVEPSGTNLRVYSTVWHNVESATAIMLYGPAPREGTGGAIMSLVPLAGSANPANCPIERTFVLSSQHIDTLRDGLMYVQIDSATDPDASVRGQIESRNDIYISFALAIAPVPAEVEDAAGFFVGLPPTVPPRNTFIPVGMGIIHLEESINPERAVINSWIMLRAANEPLILGTDADSGHIHQTFGPLPPRPPTIPALVIFNDTSIKSAFVIRQAPVFGPDSSQLDLAIQSTDGTPYRLGQFQRLPLVSETTAPKFGGREGEPEKEKSAAAGSVHAGSRLAIFVVIFMTVVFGVAQ